MKVYTKTGDKGMTSLYNGQRVLKSHLRFQVLGASDELSSQVGLVRSRLYAGPSEKKAALPSVRLDLVDGQLERIQMYLQEFNSHIATPLNEKTSTERAGKTELPESRVVYLENAIDRLDADLPILKNFVLPSGVEAACLAHVARTTTRRCERKLVLLLQDTQEVRQISPIALKFVNRLSDYFFVAARYINMAYDVKETIYRPSE